MSELLPIIKLHQLSKGEHVKSAIENSNTIWCDFEQHSHDARPALVGVLKQGEFEQVVFDPLLLDATKTKSEMGRPVRFSPWKEWLKEVYRQVKQGHPIAGYSSHERTILLEGWGMSGISLDAASGAFYLDCNLVKLLKAHNAELHSELLNKKKKSRAYGRPSVGLKDLLIHESTAYNYPNHLRSFKVGQCIVGFREQQTKKGAYTGWSAGTKRKWTNLLEYNEHDVRGMKFITEWAWRNWLA